MTYITKNILTVESNGRTYFNCNVYSSVIPSIFLRFGSHWIEVRPEHYTNDKDGNGLCEIMLAYNEGYWALGLPVLRGYYTIFDVANDRVGFAPRTTSSNKPLDYDPPENPEETPLVQPVDELSP
jgi:Eukaryotic aspartyl protease